MQAVRLELDQPVDIREEQGRIVIEPIRRQRYDIGEKIVIVERCGENVIDQDKLFARFAFGDDVLQRFEHEGDKCGADNREDREDERCAHGRGFW